MSNYLDDLDKIELEERIDVLESNVRKLHKMLLLLIQDINLIVNNIKWK